MKPRRSIEPINESICRERLFIRRPEMNLEAVLSYPDSGAAPSEAVLILSPHPNFAGDMENNVIRALADGLISVNRMTLRFNYPGVAGSAGALPPGASCFDYWKRLEESQDFGPADASVDAALEYLQSAGEIRRGGVHAVGYSYGGLAAARLAARAEGFASVVAIAPPWKERYDYGFCRRLKQRVVFISGAEDFVLDRSVRKSALADALANGSAETIDLKGEDHFFRGTEWMLVRRVEKLLSHKEPS